RHCYYVRVHPAEARLMTASTYDRNIFLGGDDSAYLDEEVDFVSPGDVAIDLSADLAGVEYDELEGPVRVGLEPTVKIAIGVGGGLAALVLLLLLVGRASASAPTKEAAVGSPGATPAVAALAPGGSGSGG